MSIFVRCILILCALFLLHETTSVYAGWGTQKSRASQAGLASKPSKTYRVGEAFRASEVVLRVRKGGRYTYYRGNDLRFWANTVPIRQGYRFKEPGRKVITVKKGNYKAVYYIYVYSNNSIWK